MNKRYFIAQIQPKIEIRRNGVAVIRVMPHAKKTDSVLIYRKND
jgi:hypothetical protein